MKNITVITGATGGLGKAFSRLCVQRGYSVLLTGRSEEKLRSLETELRLAYANADVQTLACDMSDESSRARLQQAMQADGVRVERLINVAGVDIQKAFSAYTEEKIVFQTRVNFEAPVALCFSALKNRARRLEIVNVSSVSGLCPMPYFAIYSATKGALTSFSVALREELRGQNVCVTAVVAGAMPTREDVKEQIRGQGLWGKLAAKSPEWVAEKSLQAAAKNKGKYVAGFWNKVMNALLHCLPSAWKIRFIANRWSKISKDAF